MKDSRSAPGCGGVAEVVHPGRAVGVMEGEESFIENGHEIVTATGYTNSFP